MTKKNEPKPEDTDKIKELEKRIEKLEAYLERPHYPEPKE